jgi:hypothetical protein
LIIRFSPEVRAYGGKIRRRVLRTNEIGASGRCARTNDGEAVRTRLRSEFRSLLETRNSLSTMTEHTDTDKRSGSGWSFGSINRLPRGTSRDLVLRHKQGGGNELALSVRCEQAAAQCSPP